MVVEIVMDFGWNLDQRRSCSRIAGSRVITVDTNVGIGLGVFTKRSQSTIADSIGSITSACEVPGVPCMGRGSSHQMNWERSVYEPSVNTKNDES